MGRKHRNKKKKNGTKAKPEGVDEVLGGAEVYNPEAAEAKEALAVDEIPSRIISYVDDINVQIDEEVYAKVMHWIDKASGEVSGLGKIVMEDGIFRVTSAILLKQTNSAMATDLDAAAVGKAMFELKDEPGALNWWWHSHVNMETFWSGTDMDTIHEFGNQGWVLATVLNKKRSMRSCYYQKGTGFIPQILVDDIPTTTVFMAEAETFEHWDKEFVDKVTEKKYQTPSWVWKKTPPSVGSYTPRENSWEGAEVYSGGGHGWPPLPGNSSYVGGKTWEDEPDGEDATEGLDGAFYTDNEISQMVLAEIKRQEAQEVGEKRRVKKGKRK